MRRTADLHLRPEIADRDSLECMAQIADEMGFSHLGIAFDLTTPKEKKKDALHIFEKQGIDALSRTDITRSRHQDLLRVLPKARASFDLVAVECSSRQVSSLAFRDRRIDIVYFNAERPRFDHRNFISKNANRLIEINLSDILSFKPLDFRLARAMAQIAEAKRNRAPMLISSGATGPLSMRGPQEMASLAMIAGLDLPTAMNAVSDTPVLLADSRLRRRNPAFVAEGVRLVR